MHEQAAICHAIDALAWLEIPLGEHTCEALVNGLVNCRRPVCHASAGQHDQDAAQHKLRPARPRALAVREDPIVCAANLDGFAALFPALDGGRIR